MTVAKGSFQTGVVFGVIGFLAAFLPGLASAQLDLATGSSLDFINLIRGDLEIRDQGQPNMEYIYSSEEGPAELEVMTKTSRVSVQAKSIHIREGQTEVLAQGGVIISDGTSTIKGDTGRYWVSTGKVQFDGNAQLDQKIDRERNNSWTGTSIEAYLAQGAGSGGLKSVKLKGGGGRIYPGKGQMGSLMKGQKGEKKGDGTKVQVPKATPTGEPESTPTPKPMERIMAPMAQ